MENIKRTWLIRLRKERGLNRTEVSKLIGTTQAFYSYIENGQRRPSPEVAQKIGKVLNFDWTKFYPKTKRKTE